MREVITMKLDEKIVMQGVFSVDEGDTYDLAGALEISESGEIYLDCIHKMSASNLDQKDMVNLTGETSALGKILLIDSFTVSSEHKFSGDLSRSKLFCNKMVCVDKNHQGYDLKTSKMTFEIEDLEKWIAKPIINSEWKDNKKIYSYDLPDMERIELGDGLSLTLSHSMTISTGNFHERTEVRSKAFAIFESAEEKDLDFFIDNGVTLSNLVSFALDSVCTIKNSYYGEHNNNRVIYQTANKIKKRKEINLVNYYFTMRSAGDRSAEIIKNWFLLSKKLRPTISLYTQLKSGTHQYTEAAFLSLAQAAEALHRRTCNDTPMSKSDYRAMVKDIIEKSGEKHEIFLKEKLSYGYEYSFRQRLELMLSVCWSDEKIKEREDDIRKIVQARNIFTHYPSKGDEILNEKLSKDLHDYTKLLENIIVSNILFIISSNDKEWTLSIMQRINKFRYRDF